MLVGKARVYLRVEQLKCASLGKAPGLTCKHWTRLDRSAREKHSSLLRKFVNYGRKRFYNGYRIDECEDKAVDKF
jgi:hypothetical protein